MFEGSGAFGAADPVGVKRVFPFLKRPERSVGERWTCTHGARLCALPPPVWGG